MFIQLSVPRPVSSTLGVSVLIIKRLSKYWQNTKQMPFFLRAFCQGGMVAPPILFIFLVLPIAPVEVNGASVSYAELWSSGVGEVMSIFLGLAGAGAWGIAARSGGSRWLIILAPVVPTVLMVIIPASSSFMQGLSVTGVLVEAAVTAIVLYAYLFRIRSIQMYFNQERRTE